MKPGVQKFLDRVQRLASTLRIKAQAQRQPGSFAVEKRRPWKPAWAPTRSNKEGLWAYVFMAEWRHVLCVPFIYPVLLPMLLLDFFVILYQWVCFPLCGIPRVRRSAFWVFDRTHLGYLNGLEKINCAYCSYANGLIAYCREVFGLTEKYWCPIKHAHQSALAHPHAQGFADFGDAENYRSELSRLRAQLQGMRDETQQAKEASSAGGASWLSRLRHPIKAKPPTLRHMKTFASLADLAACVGQHVATSDWVDITQQQVNQFAESTGDHQWIHVDVARAQQGPFGAPIAHGFLTLSLLPQFFDKTIEVTEVRMGVNYGLNKVRFMAPVPVGSRLRAQLHLHSATPIDGQGLQLQWNVTVEREGSDKPVCVAESLVRLYP